LNGTIKRWVEDRGYGFIDAHGRDFFVHRTSLPAGLIPTQGMRVTFTPQTTDKGESAVHVKVDTDSKEGAWAVHEAVRFGENE
jgi:cold shock CspA family protein